jgi:hypothetical protein
LLNAAVPRAGREIAAIAIAKINFKKMQRILPVAFGACGGIQFQMLGFASLSSISEMEEGRGEVVLRVPGTKFFEFQKHFWLSKKCG